MVKYCCSRYGYWTAIFNICSKSLSSSERSSLRLKFLIVQRLTIETITLDIAITILTIEYIVGDPILFSDKVNEFVDSIAQSLDVSA